MSGFEALLQSCDVGDMLDDIASADPPAYLHRCFAEGCSSPSLSWPRVQQLAFCAMVLDAILHGHEYPALEPELISDWRGHFSSACARMRPLALEALRHASAAQLPTEAAGGLDELTQRLEAA